MNSFDDIAKVPVKCEECSIWWRGLTHRCEPVAPQNSMSDNWKKYKPDYEKREEHDKYIATTPEKNLNTPNVNYKKVWGGSIV